jgi:hypothetical protein
MHRCWPTIVCLLVFHALVVPAIAVDGVIEINQAAVFAGGITPGDTPGFPATISQSGSYRLTGNLDVTKMQDGNPQPNSQDITAIVLGADDVTIDLNGFEVGGPVTCTGRPLTCMPANGNGNGIAGSAGFGRRTAVVNGTVRGMGNVGVVLDDGGRIESVRAVSNGFFGLVTSLGIIRNCIVQFNGGGGMQATGSVVTNNHARDNRSRGISAAEATVIGNTANSNGFNGIEADGSVVIGNVASFNVGFGLEGNASTGYGTNVFNGNNSNGAQVSAGLNQIVVGSNVCGGDTTCP